MLNLSSNDYLGLASDREWLARFFSTLPASDALMEFGLGASASRLLAGNHAGYDRLENRLANAYGREAALIFNSGYHANLGILPALVREGDAVFSDRLNHASLLDGLRLSGAKLFRYPHLDFAFLRTLLSKYRSHYRRAVILTESLFSMDGDCADLRILVDLKNQYQAWLYVDEAHAFGVLGTNGLGLAEMQGVIPEIEILVGTFGKALGSVGAFAITETSVRDCLLNHARPFIFSTALPPVILHWLSFCLDQPEALGARRARLAGGCRVFREALLRQGLSAPSGHQIVPIHAGENRRALQAASHLQDLGYLVMAVRPPTVPKGTARLRLSLTSLIPEAELAPLAKAVAETLTALV